ncbi:hypothetical protein TDIS_1659 [Thermosulfurimonas dismutans]|uniref:Uncharacterized protein n=1 Tax=Thermosulfurimonas dismutans TaxID=999894 RepID=A0A179D2J6_9BACT|nr:hypothetical protein [Thermosulfurimonas dismutans]OAQ20304.1 hypothetical protein TDIS_1659 [Thermosulfurimonas dismutans]
MKGLPKRKGEKKKLIKEVTAMKQNNPFTEEFLEQLKDWENFVPREFLSWLFKNLGLAHRAIHLKKHPHDKGNGFYERTLQIGYR